MIIGNHNIKPFVVCVPEMPERTEKILKHFKEVGLEGVWVWNGFNSAISGLTTTHFYEYDNPGTSYCIGPKCVCTWISFYSLWNALTLLPDDMFLICEWDCQFHTDWKERTERALRDAPDQWDMIYLGSCCTESKPKKHIKGELWNVLGVMCGHATLVRKKALPILLATQRKVYSPLDVSVSMYAHPHLNVNVLLPRCADQFDTFLPK